MNTALITAIICTIHLSVFALILTLKKANQQANRVLAFYMLLLAFNHMYHIIQLTNNGVKLFPLNEILCFTILFNAPTYLLYTSLITGIDVNWKKHIWWHLLPFAIGLIYLVNALFRTHEEVVLYYEYLKTKQPLDAMLVIITVTIQVAVYMFWSLKLIIIKQKMNLIAQSTLSISWLKIITIFIIVIAIIVAPVITVVSNADINVIYIFFPFVTIFIYIALFVKAINFPSSENEKRIILELEREKINRDLHDELGTGLSKISIISEVMKSKIDHNNTFGNDIKNISDTANDLVDSMSQIVWSLNSKNDSIENIIAYLREFIYGVFDRIPIEVNIDFPLSNLQLKLNQEQRRNIFLVVKESVNNILKHSNAKKVNFKLTTNESLFQLHIKDDGVGFCSDDISKFSNGLANMQKRMELIGGTYTISSEKTIGTTTEIYLKV